MESGWLDLVVSVSKSPELVDEKWVEEISRVLKPGGAVLVQAFYDQSEYKVGIHRRWNMVHLLYLKN